MPSAASQLAAASQKQLQGMQWLVYTSPVELSFRPWSWLYLWSTAEKH